MFLFLCLMWFSLPHGWFHTWKMYGILLYWPPQHILLFKRLFRLFFLPLSLFDDLPRSHPWLEAIAPPPTPLEPWPRSPLRNPHLPLNQQPPPLWTIFIFTVFFPTHSLVCLATSKKKKKLSSFLSPQIKIRTLSFSLFVSFYVQCQSVSPPAPLLHLVFENHRNRGNHVTMATGAQLRGWGVLWRCL